MGSDQIALVSAAVVALTQIVKWAGLPDKWGPLAVLVLAGLGTALWAYSQDTEWTRSDLWTYVSGWIVVAVAAAGVFGFTRAAASAVTAAKAPPVGGAGQNPTVDR